MLKMYYMCALIWLSIMGVTMGMNLQRKSETKVVQNFLYLEEHKKLSADIVCPGGNFSCPMSSTCCESPTGSYDCCQFSQAVCCSDHLHCCPKNYRCDVSKGACSRNKETISWKVKHPLKPINGTATSVVCPGGEQQCPDGTTCCKMQTGEYGCCPYPKAVCCSDGIHCCPDGYTCDIRAGLCAQKPNVYNELIQVQAKQIEDIICPDGSMCPKSNTCCEIDKGQYGCCPLLQAVCCSDHAHCCPNGYQCDVSVGTCNKGDEVVLWFTKGSAKRSNL